MKLNNSKLNKNNKSGYPGIYLESKINKYRAAVNICGTKIQLGHFSSLQDAVNAKQSAEQIFNNEGLIPFVAKLSNSPITSVEQNLIPAFVKYNFSNPNSSFPAFFLSFAKKYKNAKPQIIPFPQNLSPQQLLIFNNFTKSGLSLSQIASALNSSIYLVKNALINIQTTLTTPH